jgi:hypothetical protein
MTVAFILTTSPNATEYFLSEILSLSEAKGIKNLLDLRKL